MTGKTVVVLLSGLLVACAQTQSPEATAPPEPAQALAATPAPAPAPPQAAPQIPAPAPPQAPAAEVAPVDHVINIERAGCEDLLRLSPEDRAAASMFYIGYQASRSRA